MWICLNNAFLSVVDKAKKPGHLLVRARVPGHIEAVFPDAVVEESTNTDYRYRAEVSRLGVVNALGRVISEMDYPNFKASVHDKPLHDAYMGVWHVMERLQPGGAYGSRLRRDGKLPL